MPRFDERALQFRELWSRSLTIAHAVAEASYLRGCRFTQRSAKLNETDDIIGDLLRTPSGGKMRSLVVYYINSKDGIRSTNTKDSSTDGQLCEGWKLTRFTSEYELLFHFQFKFVLRLHCRAVQAFRVLISVLVDWGCYKAIMTVRILVKLVISIIVTNFSLCSSWCRESWQRLHNVDISPVSRKFNLMQHHQLNVSNRLRDDRIV